MAETLKYYGHIERGVISLPANVRDDMIQVFEGKRIQVIVKEDRPTRSNPENRYYWGVIVPHVVAGFVSAGNGWMSPYNKEHCELVHTQLKRMFLEPGETVIMPDGSTFQAEPTTTTLSTFEAETYYETVRQWALEMFGIQIPLPNEVIA